MGTGARRMGLVGTALVIAGLTACGTQREADLTAPVIPPAQQTVPATGPGTYVGEAVNKIGTPVPVRVTIGADTSVPPTADAQAVGAFLRGAAAQIGGAAPGLRYVSVNIDNTGQIDAVPLPGNVDVLDAGGRGANFRPAYDVVRESLELLPEGTDLQQSGAVLVRRLQIRENSVRPGQVVTVPYVSNDPLADVAQVVVNGELARKDAPA